MIAVVIPAHNEEAFLAHCLESVCGAAAHPELAACPVKIVVVLDRCTDRSSEVAARFGVECLRVDAGNVGVARSAGAQHAIDAGAHWLAFTDADTRVPPDWLPAQLALRAAAVCGTVDVDSWQGHDASTQLLYDAHYQCRNGHRHIHGANLGVSALAYRRAGGFPALACGEDVALVERLMALGEHVVWSAYPSVRTSARRDARVRGGFGDFLLSLEQRAQCRL